MRSPPPLSSGRLLEREAVLLLVVMIGMLWLAGAKGDGEPRSSSESLLLELSSLLEEEELWESEELSPLLIWSMTRASAINSVYKHKIQNQIQHQCKNYPHWHTDPI